MQRSHAPCPVVLTAGVRSGTWTLAVLQHSLCCELLRHTACYCSLIFLIRKTQKKASQCRGRKLKGGKECLKRKGPVWNDHVDWHVLIWLSSPLLWKRSWSVPVLMLSHQFFYLLHGAVLRQAAQRKQWSTGMDFSVGLGFITFHQSHWLLFQCLFH